MRKNEKITALYERLSRDDFGKDDDQQRESNSISNQKAMLEEFAARQGFTNIVHFTDDGISGTCFDRPGFLAMMKEVEAGNVEYLCIKDMSRMGRDYLKVGQIMEILRQRGVRLIAINDGVDSARGDDDFTPFRNIMNEYYARDTSRKIRSTFQSKGKSGNADTIIGNMDTSIFLGGKEPTTLKELSAALGKETIDTFNTGESRGREVSHSLNYQKLGKELMSQDELAVMDGGKCVLQLRGVRPFLSNKYDITKHPNYKYTSDFDKRNELDIERFLSHRLRLKADAVCEVYEVNPSDTTA